MLGRSRWVHGAALLLLLLAGAELLACDLFSPSACEFSSSASDDDCGGAASGDGCLCCCRHIVVVRPAVVAPAEFVSPAPSLTVRQPAAADPTSIFHPPNL